MPLGNFNALLNTPPGAFKSPSYTQQSLPQTSTPNYLGELVSGVKNFLTPHPTNLNQGSMPIGSPFMSGQSPFANQNALTQGFGALSNAMGMPPSPFAVNKSGGATFTPPTTAPASPATPPVVATKVAAPVQAQAGTMQTPPATSTGPTPEQVKAYQAGLSAAPQSGFSINTTGAIPSNALSSSTTSADVLGTRNKYQDYLEGLYQATIPSKPYLDALKQVQDAKQMQMQIQANYLTNPQGDTLGFASGVSDRANALNALNQNAATNALSVQEAIRSGNIDAYKALVAGAQPQPLSYGQQLTDPINGTVVATGQNQPSYSASASPFGGYMVFNQRTGQYEVVNPQGTGAAGAGGQVPSFLQPALGSVGNSQYLDMSVITPQQIPYAQQVSASTGIPLLSKDDVNKVQDAQTVYQTGVGMITNLNSLASPLITATSPAAAAIQAAKLNIEANIPGTQAALYSNAKNGFLSLITRGLGEKGALAEGDIARIQAALPSFSDTAQTAATKIKTVNDIFQSAVMARVNATLGSKLKDNSNTGAPSMSGGGIDMSQYGF